MRPSRNAYRLNASLRAGLANELTTIKEAKKYYPLFGLGANVALIFSGQYVRYVSNLRKMWAVSAPHIDPWAASLRYLMGGVVASGLAILGTLLD